MSRLVWGNPDKRLYEFGVDRGVFYPGGGLGVPWSGLISVSEAPSGADVVKGYYDGNAYFSRRASESYTATIEAYTYPFELESYEVVYENRPKKRPGLFNLSYRTRTGDGFGNDEHFKIHLIYNAYFSPTNRSHKSLTTSVSAETFSWEINTIPEILSTGEISAHVIVDTRYAYPWAIKSLEEILYGTDFSDPRFPTIPEIFDLIEDASILKVTDLGDGVAEIRGPDDLVTNLGGDLWEIGEWPTVVQIDTHTYRLTSL